MSTTAPTHTPPADHSSSRWSTIVGMLPNLVVFTLLAAAFYGGHRTGWKMPKLSELMNPTAATTADWCDAHSVPESVCVECNPDLLPLPADFGFCQKHGVADCVLDHPELAQVTDAPQMPKYDTAAAIAVVPRPENNSRNTLHRRRVQFASAESAEKAGVEVDVVDERPMIDFVAANGELTFDPTRVAHLSARAAGTVAVVYKTLGDETKAGEVLALVDSASVGQAKSQLLQAIVQLQLRKTTLERLHGIGQGAVPQRSLIEAETALQEAQIALVTARQSLANMGLEVPETFLTFDAARLEKELRFLGIPIELISELLTETMSANLIPVRAPYAGAIVMADVVVGEVISTTTMLFTVADVRRMWLILGVRPEDARHVKLGEPVKFRIDTGEELSGRVSWISSAIDEQTRTLKVRVTIEAKEEALRDKTFGTARIILREEPQAIVVPAGAVQSTGDAHFVFVRDKNYLQPDAPKVFHARQVRIGAKDDGYVELLAGVLPGEVVATAGSSVLLSQLLKSNLGAGCGCHH